MKLLKKLFIALGILVALLIIANFGVSYYLKKKLPALLKEQKNFPYNVSYKDIDIDILAGSFTIHDASLAPKESINKAVKNGIFGQVKAIHVNGLKLWQLYKHNRIIANSVIIEEPEIIFYHTQKKYNVRDDIEKPFKQYIQTGKLQLLHGNFKMLDSVQNPKLRATDINFTLNNIKIDSTTVDDKVPVRYRDYTFDCDSLYYNAGLHYNIMLKTIKTTDSTLAIKNFKLVTKQTRKQFSHMLAKELDQFTIKAGNITVPKADWGFINDTLYVHTPKVVMEQVYANIYRSKEPADDPMRKKLYSEMLRSIKFDLAIDQLLIKNSLVEYEEQANFSKPAAKVTFSKFYATVNNVYSPVNKHKLPNTTIDVKCLFMQHAPLSVNWTFNTLDTSDSFTILGHLQNLESDKVNPVSLPLMNVTTTGNLKDIQFVFNGNRDRASGTFAIDYSGLKVGIYKKDGKKKNKITTALGNLLVKNDSDGKPEKVDVKIDRKKDKSVFNFLWRFVMEGLKQTLLPGFIT